MRLRYLGWAGVEIEHNGETVLIDYVEDGSGVLLDKRFAEPSKAGGATAALVTHLHSDHADPAALKRALAEDAPVIRPEPARGSAALRTWTRSVEDAFCTSQLLTHIMQPWTELQIGPFRIIAAPAVDGLGDPQRTYIVEAGGYRILHAGDTMNHGYWWGIAELATSIDVAFVPVNAPVVNLPHLQPSSPFQAVMSPEEAAYAAAVVGARTIVPIHFGDIRVPNVYVETENHIERLEKEAAERGIQVYLPAEGEWFPARADA